MSKLFGNAAQGFPALIGVLWGIANFSPQVHRWWIPVLVLAGALVLVHAGKGFVGHNIFVGWGLIETWVAATVSIVALGTMLILWLTIHASSFIQGTEEEKKAISAALVGAVTSYLAVLWAKDIQAAEGQFWTGTQFKSAIQDAFKCPLKAPAKDTVEWDAVWEPRVRGNGPTGWGFTSRWRRSRIIGQYLKRKASNPPAGEDS